MCIYISSSHINDASLKGKIHVFFFFISYRCQLMMLAILLLKLNFIKKCGKREGQVVIISK